MDFTLSEDNRMIASSAREFAERELRERAPKMDQKEEFDETIVPRLAEVGFLGTLVGEQYGGTELGTLNNSIILEEIARVCASTAVTIAVHNSLVCAPIFENGTDEQKERFLPKLTSGEALGAYSVSEPDAGSDAGSMRLSATDDGDAFVLTGTKSWVTSASYAGVFLVFARSSKESKSRGITCFIVENGTPGFSVGKKEKKTGIRGSATCSLVFDGCRVSKKNVLGEPGKGFHLALRYLDSGRIGIGAQATGIAQACLEVATKYSQERQQFDRPISEFQLIQWKLAEMALQTSAARVLVQRAASLKDAGQPHAKEASMAKLFASRAANFCAKEGVQIHGGYGYIKEFDIERYFRDARITEIYEGTSQVQQLVISRHVLGKV
ncbi:MAG: acyl-CoA dehydrogenase family protein [Planctomycetes bacterium]|nr:acyl-CoA dehydrogenase family protein [Planctomycetota bacterium]